MNFRERRKAYKALSTETYAWGSCRDIYTMVNSSREGGREVNMRHSARSRDSTSNSGRSRRARKTSPLTGDVIRVHSCGSRFFCLYKTKEAAMKRLSTDCSKLRKERWSRQTAWKGVLVKILKSKVDLILRTPIWECHLPIPSLLVLTTELKDTSRQLSGKLSGRAVYHDPRRSSTSSTPRPPTSVCFGVAM